MQAGIYDRFTKELPKRAAELPVGDGFTHGVALGPLIDAAAVEKVTEHVNDAAAHGGELFTGGSPHRQGPLFLQPTVLTQAMLVAREETFGPITPLIRFTDEAEVIGWANDTEFGLISNEVAPFGGMKQSGIGREGSVYGIDEYLEINTWPGKARRVRRRRRAAPGVKYQSAGKDHHGRRHEERVP